MTAATMTAPTTAFPSALIDGMKEAVPNAFPFAGNLVLCDSLQSPEQPCKGIFAVIGFVGDLPWSFTFVLPESTAEAMVQSFVGFDIPYSSPDMGDVVGELANVLAGEVVSQLHNRKIEVRMSLPTVARGTDVEVLMPEGAPQVRLQYRCGAGPFWFKLIRAKPSSHWHRRPA